MLTFFNWTDSKFSYPWGGNVYTFEAGKVYSDMIVSDGGVRIILEAGIVDHFARHLADQEMNEKRVDSGRLDIYEQYRSNAKVLPVATAAVDEETADEPTADSEEATQEAPVQEKKKAKPGRKPKQVVSDDTSDFQE